MATFSEIVNNERLLNTFVNLYERWQDEREYEDINDYGKFIYKTLADQFPNDGYKLMASTKRPFGIKVTDGEGKSAHIFVKVKGGYLTLCIKKL